jgi:hypothetical protein
MVIMESIRHHQCAPTSVSATGGLCPSAPWIGLVLLCGCLAYSQLAAQTRLLAPTENAAELAYALAVDGQRLAAGAPGAASRSGLVYTYDCLGQSCSTAAPLFVGDLDFGDLYGSAIALSGNTMAVGAPGQGAGAVYVFVHDGFGWLLQQKLAASPVSPGERVGAALALQGDRLAVGAPGADGEAGALVVFERTGGMWNQVARLQADDGVAGNAFGSSVALSGDTLLVGAPERAFAQAGAYSQGAAYVFQYISPNWLQQTQLLPPLATNGQLFGHALSLVGNRALIGAPLADARIGGAFVFERSGSLWTQQAQLAAPNGLPGDRFGWSVALDGDQLLVGAPYSLASCGGSHRFVSSGGSWVLMPAAGASKPILGGLAGWSVAIQAQRTLIGVPGYSGAPSHVGAADWRDASDGIFNDGFEDPGIAACVPPA